MLNLNPSLNLCPCPCPGLRLERYRHHHSLPITLCAEWISIQTRATCTTKSRILLTTRILRILKLNRMRMAGTKHRIQLGQRTTRRATDNLTLNRR